MKEHLHLFTPVTEGLPEKDNEYLCIKNNPHFGGDIVFGCKFEKHQGFLSGSVITHWLDLSKLTTKEKAKEAIEKVKIESRDVEDGFMGVISERFVDKSEALKFIL